MLKIIARTLLLLSIPLSFSCSENLLSELEEETTGLGYNTADITLNGLDQEVTLPEKYGNVSQIIATEGCFITPLGGNHFFVEQNDGTKVRTASLTVIDTDGHSRTCKVSQAPISLTSQAEKYNNFYRNYGIGYSYNAITGDYCNLSDVRCQLINRAVLDRLQPNYPDIFLLVDKMNEMSVKQSVSTSLTNYIQNTNFKASADGQIMILFSGGIEQSCHIFEDGITDSYILHQEQLIKRARYFLDAVAVAEAAKTTPTILTASFRSAINELAQTSPDNWEAIDKFINLYGTHVIINSTLGAKMELNLQVEEKKFHTIEEVNVLSNASIALLFKKYSESQATEEEYKKLKNSKCQIDVLGGDLSKLDNVLHMTLFNNEDYSPAMLDEWVASVNFDDEDINKSNVELIDMEVTPIWDLIPDPDVARRVEARVNGNVDVMQEYLGNRNFINTSFKINPSGLKFLAAGKSVTAASAPIINVIAGNRVVATICKEYVPEIGGEAYKNDLKTVVYPVYEGRIQIRNGLCIFNRKAYEVAWNDDRFSVTPLGAVSDTTTVYMSLGKLSVDKYANITYQPSYLIPSLECIRGIQPDGSINPEKFCSVFKHFGDFYLGLVYVNDNTFNITSKTDDTNFDYIPYWEWTTDWPEYMKNYLYYFTQMGGIYRNTMVRTDDYLYIYNPSEVAIQY